MLLSPFYRWESYGYLGPLIDEFELLIPMPSSNLASIYFFFYYNLLFCLYCLALFDNLSVNVFIYGISSLDSLDTYYFLSQPPNPGTTYMTRWLRARSPSVVAYMNCILGLGEKGSCFPRLCFSRRSSSIWYNIRKED